MGDRMNKKIKIAGKKIEVKSIIYVAIFLVVVIAALCFIPSKKKVTACYNTIDQGASGYRINTKYKINSTNDVVKKVEITDTIISSNNTILAYLEKQYKNLYEEQNKKYGGYTVSTEKKKEEVIVKVTIDYSDVDLKKLAKDNPSIAKKVKNNKLSLTDAKSIYTNLGATCDK